MATLRTLLGDLWTKYAPLPVDRRQWCAPIQPGDVIDRVMRAVARYPGVRLDRLDGSGEAVDLPPLDGHVTPGLARTVREHFARHGWAITQLLTGVAQRLAEDVRTTRQSSRPAGIPGGRDISAWAVGVVAASYTRSPALPSEDDLAEATAAFWRNRTGPSAEARAALRISPAEFSRRFAREYDDLWAKRGESPSPVLLGLGALCRPPLTAPESSWRSGTDRSVLSRYHHYIRRRDWCQDIPGVAEVAGLDPQQHVSVRIIGATVEDLAGRELRRVCSPLGLDQPAHRALVTTAARALVEADVAGTHETRTDTGRRRSLTVWASAAADLHDGEDPLLHDALVGYARGWAGRDPSAADLVGLLGDVITWSVQVELGVVRRVWHWLHAREVEWEAPLRRVEAVRVLRGAFTRHLRELASRPIEDVRGADPAPAPLPEDPRLAATITALGQLGPTAMQTLLDALHADPATWREAYLAATGGATGLLTPEKLRRWLGGNVLAAEGEAG